MPALLGREARAFRINQSATTNISSKTVNPMVMLETVELVALLIFMESFVADTAQALGRCDDIG